ncbi:MAG: ABC transporter ATP-binding protein [Spirochaetaceae bacterium]|nr:MAG: ABC transporter ATP-binding protein [Spirochaetaceae bacterium]
MQEPILCVKDIVIKFSLRGRVLTAIRGASLELHKGRTLAIVGESGSGKSVFTKSFIGMLDENGWIDSGQILYGGDDLATFKTEKRWLRIRGRKIAMVFQDPMTALNPLRTIGAQIQEVIEQHETISRRDAKARTLSVLNDVGISEPDLRYGQYPHEFSGGMRQRIVIAIALASNPEILICDEPTTALDVTIQAQILELIRAVQARYNLTVIYITHDLGVVANVADTVAVMYAGDIVEYGNVEEIFYNAKHPYTWALLSSLPQLGKKGEPLYTITGSPPNLFMDIQGDAFASRNPLALNVDFVERPPYFKISKTHYARTWLLDERAPSVDPPETIKHLLAKYEQVHHEQ